MRVECEIGRSDLTIIERRAPWRADFGPEWSRLPIARLRYTKASRTWTLYWRVFSNPNGVALHGTSLTVDGGMWLRKAQCIGIVRLPDAHIKGRLDCSEAVFSNPDGVALHAEGLTSRKIIAVRSGRSGSLSSPPLMRWGTDIKDAPLAKDDTSE